MKLWIVIIIVYCQLCRQHVITNGPIQNPILSEICAYQLRFNSSLLSLYSNKKQYHCGNILLFTSAVNGNFICIPEVATLLAKQCSAEFLVILCIFHWYVLHNMGTHFCPHARALCYLHNFRVASSWPFSYSFLSFFFSVKLSINGQSKVRLNETTAMHLPVEHWLGWTGTAADVLYSRPLGY